MIHVPLKKRFKLYECMERETSEEKGGQERESSSYEEERGATQSPQVVDSPAHIDSPLCSNVASPLTPESSDSAEKCDECLSTADPSLSSSPEHTVSTSSSTTTAFKPFISAASETMVQMRKRPSNNPEHECAQYLPAFTLMPSAYLNYLRYNEGVHSMGLSSESVKLLETTAIGRKLSTYSSRCAKDKRRPKLGDAFDNENTTEEQIEIEELLNESARKRKAPKTMDQKDEQYWDKRRRNNASAKRSRDARRARELETQINFAFLLEENRKLTTEVAVLREENATLRGMVCDSSRSAK